MRTNRTKAKVEAGKTAFGAAVGFHSPDTVELLGALGFDYVTLDLEHEVFDELAVQHSIRAAEAFNITPVVRIPNDPNVILPRWKLARRPSVQRWAFIRQTLLNF